MPQINPNDKQDKVDQSLNFRQRLMNRFAAHEWVRVINLDDEAFIWQYLPSHAETFNYTPDPTREVYREAPEVWELQPGESEVIIGENAYVMIEALYKKLVSKGFIKKNGEYATGKPGRNFNWSDGKTQEDLINKIYLGKETPSFGDATPKAPDTPRSSATTSRLRAAE